MALMDGGSAWGPQNERNEFWGSEIAHALHCNYSSTTSNASLWGPQMGQTQSSGRSSHAVTGKLNYFNTFISVDDFDFYVIDVFIISIVLYFIKCFHHY